MNIGYNFKTCILELWGCKYYALCIYKYIYIVDTLPPIKKWKTILLEKNYRHIKIYKTRHNGRYLCLKNAKILFYLHCNENIYLTGKTN